MQIKTQHLPRRLFQITIMLSSFSAFGNGFMAQWEEIPETLEDPSLFTLQQIIDEEAIEVKKEAQTAWRPEGAS